MKKHTERQPIDDLFARKLGDMSLPPSPAGFERLKARMAESERKVRVVFWRNPTIQRYMAAAACLVLVSLFGWLYWPSSTPLSDTQVAGNNHKKTNKYTLDQKQAGHQIDTSDAPMPQPLSKPEVLANQVAQAVDIKTENRTNYKVPSRKGSLVPKAPTLRSSFVNNNPVLAQTKPAEEKVSPELVNPDRITPASPVIAEKAEKIAAVKAPVKSEAVGEHVLEVTIAEPASLVAARQVAKIATEERAAVAENDRPEKEPKTGGLWQQVKRFKQGEVFARRDNSGNDDRGLLGRAYSGLKQSFEKDKPAKQ